MSITNEQFREYKKVLEKIESLKEKQDTLKQEIIQGMVETDTKRIKNRYGLFSLGSRVSYEYPKKVSELEIELKRVKEDSVRSGKAKIKAQTQFIRYQA